jgi:hypothetical protein
VSYSLSENVWAIRRPNQSLRTCEPVPWGIRHLPRGACGASASAASCTVAHPARPRTNLCDHERSARPDATAMTERHSPLVRHACKNRPPLAVLNVKCSTAEQNRSKRRRNVAPVNAPLQHDVSCERVVMTYDCGAELVLEKSANGQARGASSLPLQQAATTAVVRLRENPSWRARWTSWSGS